MKLPENFYYSQNKLQDYIDCPRRFQLKHLLKQGWPAVQSEPIREVEQHMLLGSQFHLFIQQYFSGLEPESIKKQINDSRLITWWNAFEKFSEKLKFDQFFSEVQISCHLDQFRFYGVIDLLATDTSGNIVIFDWKTNQNKTARHLLNQKIQTKLYRLMAALNYSRFVKNMDFSPEKIRLEYWFVNDPQTTVVFPYDEQLFLADKNFFLQLINTIQSKTSNEFELTNDESRCKFCNYRSLCARGVQAGVITAVEDILENEDILDFDLNALSELEF